ncbi:MAG: PAS domain S-box protein [Magnetococcales bacterium]|nr:PAS domain S-box protein [Magnetococcales bacterium]
MGAIQKDFLSQVAFFKGVSPTPLLAFLANLPTLEVPAGTILLSPDQHQANIMYLLLDGYLTIHFGEITSPPVRRMEPGQSVGEIGLLRNAPPTAFVVSDGPAQVIEVNEKAFWEMLAKFSQVAINMLHIFSDWLKTSTDKIISEARQLEQSESRLKAILEGVNNGILTVNPKGIIESANPAACHLFGVDADKITGALIHHYLPELVFEDYDKYKRLFFGNGKKNDDFDGVATRLTGPDGNELILEVFAGEVDVRGLRFLTLIVQDVTARHQAEEALLLLNQAMERFVPKEFITILGHKEISDVALGDSTKKRMTVLVSDIRDFTSFSEQTSPDQVFKFINAYLQRLEPIISAHGGIIDKYIGDAVMALFPEDPMFAVEAAVEMLWDLAAHNLERQAKNLPAIRCGFGINTGNLMLGTIGGHERMENTAIGDSVNLAFRIESMTKSCSSPLLITHYTLLGMHTPERFSIRFADLVRPKGKRVPAFVFEVFDNDQEALREWKAQVKKPFEQGVSLFHLGEIDRALVLLKACENPNLHDPLLQSYFNRIAIRQLNAPQAHTLPEWFIWFSQLTDNPEIIDTQLWQSLQTTEQCMLGRESGNVQKQLIDIYDFLGECVENCQSEEGCYFKGWTGPCSSILRDTRLHLQQDLDLASQEVVDNRMGEAYLILRLKILLYDWFGNV